MRPQALMEAVSANLNWFLQPIGENLTKPQKKFLRDGLVGLLRAGRPVVCRMARKLPDQGTRFLSRLDRLEGHLNHADDLDEKIKSALPVRRASAVKAVRSGIVGACVQHRWATCHLVWHIHLVDVAERFMALQQASG